MHPPSSNTSFGFLQALVFPRKHGQYPSEPWNHVIRQKVYALHPYPASIFALFQERKARAHSEANLINQGSLFCRVACFLLGLSFNFEKRTFDFPGTQGKLSKPKGLPNAKDAVGAEKVFRPWNQDMEQQTTSSHFRSFPLRRNKCSDRVFQISSV